jgi:hypothetical protein
MAAMAEVQGIRGTRRRGGRATPVRVLLLLGALAGIAFPALSEEAEKDRVAAIVGRARVDAHTRAGLGRALALALRKLETSSCREVFSAFPGAWDPPAGSPPAQEATSMFDTLLFRDGSPYRVCRDSHIVAFTHPGERSVYLCNEQFSRAAFANPDFAANILIHEGLHTLGLRENPPAPGAITARVSASCRFVAGSEQPGARAADPSGDGGRP